MDGSSLKTVHNNDCVCPADFHFEDRVACKRDGDCQERFDGPRCDDARWPAERVALEGDGVGEHRLSKRDVRTDVCSSIEAGVLQEALANVEATAKRVISAKP